jgi:hypothetical protein
MRRTGADGRPLLNELQLAAARRNVERLLAEDVGQATAVGAAAGEACPAALEYEAAAAAHKLFAAIAGGGSPLARIVNASVKAKLAELEIEGTDSRRILPEGPEGGLEALEAPEWSAAWQASVGRAAGMLLALLQPTEVAPFLETLFAGRFNVTAALPCARSGFATAATGPCGLPGQLRCL